MAKKKAEEVVEEVSWLETLHKGVRDVAPRIVFYGGHGIGKSTLGSLFPKPIFISTEDGLDAINCVSFPLCESIDEVADHIRNLIKNEHGFLTCVIDTVDWLVDPLITRDIESKHDDKELAYGKGQVMVAESFREILNGLDILRRKKNMNIVILSHAEVTRFNSPLTDPYDRFIPKLSKRANAIMQEWCDVLGYIGYRVVVKKAESGFGNKVSRGVSTGERFIHFQENPGYVAKSRYNQTPDQCEMTIEAIEEAIPLNTGAK